MLALASNANAASAVVECSMATPCTPPPKDGKPRYTMPEAGYSPAKEAEARFAEKMKAEAAAKASAPASE